MKKIINNNEYEFLINTLINKVQHKKYDAVVGIETGGAYIANRAAKELDLPLHTIHISFYDDEKLRPEPIINLKGIDRHNFSRVLLVDDLIDNGRTINKAHEVMPCEFDVGVLFRDKEYSPKTDCYFSQHKPNLWVVFPDTYVKS